MSVAGLRPRLVAVWLVLAVLVGVIVVLARTDLGGRPAGSDSPRDVRWLLPVPVDQLGALEVAHLGTLHRFERDASGAWFYHGVHTGSEGTHAHAADPAMAARIERAVAAFGRTRVERQFSLKTATGEYGVTRPETLVLLYRPNDPQPLVQYAVGDVAPDTLSRYVLAVGSSVVVTIPDYQIVNLLKLIAAVGGPRGGGPATGNAPAGRGAASGAGARGTDGASRR